MNSSVLLTRSLNLFQNEKILKSTIFNHQISSGFVKSPKQKFSRNVSSPPISLLQIQLQHNSVGFRTASPSSRGRVSSSSARFSSLPDDSEPQAPSFEEFITSERIKVVAMLALALALCNADRVVMSVAIVPLSLSHGWSRSFSGIVQVLTVFINNYQFTYYYYNFYFLLTHL